MTDSFDPYYIWLAIPPHEQPPHLYRLLGIPLYESDPNVIDNAADRQVAHLKGQLAGPHATHAEGLIRQLNEARALLLDAATKAAYDQNLRQHLARSAPAQPPAPPESMPPELPPSSPPGPSRSTTPVAAETPQVVPAIETGVRSQAPARSTRKRDSRRGESSQLQTVLRFVIPPILGLSLGFVVLSAIRPEWDKFHWFHDPDDPTARQSSSSAGDPHMGGGRAADARQNPTSRDRPTNNDNDNDNNEENPGIGRPRPTPPDQRPPRPDPDPPRRTDPPGAVAPPDAQRLAELRKELAGELQSRSADQLIAWSSGQSSVDGHRYCALLAAREKAIAEPNLSLALQTIDEMRKSYDIDVLQQKAALVEQCRQHLPSPALAAQVLDVGLAVTDQLRAAGRDQQAMQVAATALLAARQQDAIELVNQLTIRIVDLQASRTAN